MQFTDLNTLNRPTKIAESFRELYNNEWMTALDVLPNDDPLTEKKSISTLLYIARVIMGSENRRNWDQNIKIKEYFVNV